MPKFHPAADIVNVISPVVLPREALAISLGYLTPWFSKDEVISRICSAIEETIGRTLSVDDKSEDEKIACQENILLFTGQVLRPVLEELLGSPAMWRLFDPLASQQLFVQTQSIARKQGISTAIIFALAFFARMIDDWMALPLDAQASGDALLKPMQMIERGGLLGGNSEPLYELREKLRAYLNKQIQTDCQYILDYLSGFPYEKFFMVSSVRNYLSKISTVSLRFIALFFSAIIQYIGALIAIYLFAPIDSAFSTEAFSNWKSALFLFCYVVVFALIIKSTIQAILDQGGRYLGKLPSDNLPLNCQASIVKTFFNLGSGRSYIFFGSIDLDSARVVIEKTFFDKSYHRSSAAASPVNINVIKDSFEYLENKQAAFGIEVNDTDLTIDSLSDASLERICVDANHFAHAHYL